MSGAKWSLAIFAVFMFFWLLGPAIFSAMKKKDYDTLYYGMQDAKRAGGAYVQQEDKPYISYAEKYARGLE